MNRWRPLFSLLALGMAISAYGQTESVITRRDTELRDTPAASARKLADLPAETPLTRLPTRQGAYVQVRTNAGDTGWVKMFDVGPAAASSNVAKDTLRGLTSFFGKSSAPQDKGKTATATIGIRGLDAEDIARAQPNLVAVTQAEGLRQNADQARKFAANAALRSYVVEPLPAPPPPASARVQTNER